MSFDSFIPEIWSAKMLVALQKSLVYGAPDVINRDYEGEIAEQGDTVKINMIGDPTIATYTKNSTVISPENLSSASQSLVIDQSKYFAFEVDDIDKRQMAGDALPEALDRAAYKLRDTADQFIAALYTGIASAMDLGTVAITSGDLAYQYLTKLGTKLDEANVPTEGRWCVIPPWYHELLRNNTNFINADKSADGGNALRNGVIGEAAGFTLKKSNNTPLITGDDYAVMAGTKAVWSYAEQINKVVPYNPESAFSDALKGLHVYGAKLTRPGEIALLRASKT